MQEAELRHWLGVGGNRLRTWQSVHPADMAHLRLVSRTLVGIYLAITRLSCPLYRSLSLNITREVFSYISPDRLLVGFQDRRLILHVLPSETMLATCSLDLDLSGRGIVLLSDTTVLLVGNSASENYVRSVHIWTGQVRREAAMRQGRSNLEC